MTQIIKFREDRSKGQVVVYEDDREVYRHDEYRGAAEWTQRRYGIPDTHLMMIYRDYKKDYDLYDC